MALPFQAGVVDEFWCFRYPEQSIIGKGKTMG